MPTRRESAPKQSWFPTLNAALDSEGLVSLWPLGTNINYDQTIGVHAGDRYISVYRNSEGFYERPVHYRSKS